MNKEYQQMSYNALRRIIGALGILMPIALLAYTLASADCNEVMNSISTYFHTKAGHIFSAISFFIGVVMFNSIKYPEDKWLYRIAASLAIVVGFVPNKQVLELGGCLIRQNESALLNGIHFAAAVSFFVLLSYLCYFRFTKSDKAIDRVKKRRNCIFRWCGGIMFATMLVLLAYWIWKPVSWDAYRPIFVGETIMLFAFSYAWLIKGQFWMRDH